jgi:Flp pilus assembly protein TadD
VSAASVTALLDDASGAVAVGDMEEAAALFRRATEADAQCFDAWHGLGMVLMRSGELRAALGAALMATDLRPNDLLAWTSLSQIHVKMGDIAGAEAAKANARILSLGGRIVKDAPGPQPVADIE